MSTTMPDVRAIPLAAITVSTTTAQKERRAHFDKAALQELADSIKSVGVAQPILVRPFRDECVKGEAFELVFGERRVMAAKMAGLEEIPATVRELTDEQALELQLIENLKREDLHELAEAEGYEQLAKRGHSVDEIAAKVGKSRGTVYARMKLLALCPEARKAYYDGKLAASTALLIARIGGEDEQRRALATITEEGWKGRTMTYREAADYVHDNFMLKLSDAPFPRDDATLVASAGACGTCPMRTGNQPELFGDVKGADICTSPPCYQAKKAAHVKRQLEKAKETGETVIRGAAARRILPANRGYMGFYSDDGSHKHLRNGYARPSDKCLEDPKKRTWAELAGKDAPKVMLQHPDTGRVEKVFEIAAIADRLKAKGIAPPKPAKDPQEQREQEAEKRAHEERSELAQRGAIFRAIVKAAPTKLSREDLAALITKSFQLGYGDDENFYAVLGWTMPTGKGGTQFDRERRFQQQLLERSDAELAQLAVALPAIEEALQTWGDRPDELNALAKRFKLDTKKIRAEALAAIKPPEPKKPAPAKASGKKAKGKK